MSWDTYNLLNGGEQRGKDLLADSDQQGAELLSLAGRRDAPAHGTSGADARRESDREQLAA